MPLYEYECDACGQRFEVIQKFSDPPADVCRKCGQGPVRRLMSSPAIQFKGSGWYITDYAQKNKSESGKNADSKNADSKNPDGKSSDSKSSDSTSTETSTKSDAPATPSASTPTKE